ncbi:MAG: enoyl-CoA hydratase-related protein [Bacteroidales bacterium]
MTGRTNMGDTQYIVAQMEDHICTIWLSRPEKRNAINYTMAVELVGLMKQLEKDEMLRAVIIRGEGKAFCAGADLGWMHNDNLKPEEEPDSLLPNLFHTFYSFNKPLIAVVHGHVMGGALGIMAAADFVIATNSALFSFSEVKLGLIPATISPYVIRRTGEFNARRLMLSGKQIHATEARQAGLVDIIAEDNRLEDEINHLTQELLQNSPMALQACKELILSVAGQPLTQTLFDENARALKKVRQHQEAKEGMQAFLEKRKPEWTKSGKA